MNLVKELKKTAQRNYQRQLQEAETALESVKANLAMEDHADKDMLQFFGTREVVRSQQKKKVDVSKMMNSDFLTRDDIKRICCNYKLRFLNASFYKKEIPAHALSSLRKFKEANNINDYNLSQNLYMIAPSDHFQLGPRPPKDPVLLYDHQNGYSIISQWGSDFSWSRRTAGAIATYPSTILAISLLVIVNSICTLVVVSGKDDGVCFIANIIPFLFIGMVAGEITSWDELWHKDHE